MNDAKTYRLSEIANLEAGHPFRGSIEEDPDAAARAIQMKDTDSEYGIDWTNVTRTNLISRKMPSWLQNGDVLFASRGSQFYAITVDDVPGPTVCGPHFFHIRIKPGFNVIPGFVSWQINQPPFQRGLRQVAEGSNQLSIRKPILASLPINVPSLATQESIVRLAELAKQERQTLFRLMQNREHQLYALAESLADTNSSSR